MSLHAPNQLLRSTIVPSARAYKLDRLMETIRSYEEASGQRVFFEYVLLSDVNDQPEHAHELGSLLQGHLDPVLNLIPWNPVYSRKDGGPLFSAPKEDAVLRFQRIIREEYGISCTVRQEKGQDISGACGQLVLEMAQSTGQVDSSCEHNNFRDIEDF